MVITMFFILTLQVLASPLLDYFCPDGETSAFSSSNCFSDPLQPTSSGSIPYRNRITHMRNTINTIRSSILDYDAMERSGCTHCSKTTLANKYFGKNLDQWENILNGLQRSLNILDFFYPIDYHGAKKVFVYLAAQRITTMDQIQEALFEFGEYSVGRTFRKIGENHLIRVFNSIEELKNAVQVYVVDYEAWCRYKGIDLNFQYKHV